MRSVASAVLCCLSVLPGVAQDKAAKTPDTLIFTNGEQLTGALEKADGKGITFKSFMAGEISVKWENIKELRSDKNFAVLSADQKLTRRNALAVVPQGRVSVLNKDLTVTTASGPKTIPLKDAGLLVDADAFDNAVNHPPGPFEAWSGTATGGVSLVRATQDSTTFTGAIALTRAIPTVSWLPARNRTNIDYNQAYGTTSEANTPTIKTNIFHADAERDEYISPRLFLFGSTTFDHNFSQSLDLQQAYGLGVGITLIKNPHHELDFKADLHYEKQTFFDPTQNQNLAGSTFSERYLRNLRRGIVFNEFASVSPSWNNTSAYSAHINAGATFPVFKSLGLNVGAVDDYLNNAPAGSKKNSVQYSTGVSYTIKPR